MTNLRGGRSVVHLLEPVVAVIVTPIDEDGSVINARAMLAPTFKAHMGLERWGEHCPGIYHRSVFVDWRDYDGNYGFEQVNY